jgi:hypothetical protein
MIVWEISLSSVGVMPNDRYIRYFYKSHLFFKFEIPITDSSNQLST